MPDYAIYLRKSRADQEAELHGEGETLARHEKLLLDLAQKQKLNIVKIYKEVVSGESIEARPQMKQLLYDVMQGKYAGVLCVEVERLARGDTIDQGEVAKTFKFGNCVIVTPTKTYDPNDEFDEEYFEFGLFMSRREYKTINRRIQRGRIASVEEGKWIASTAPYGYNRVKIPNDKGWTLEINEAEAPTVQLIYTLYTKGQIQEDGTFRRMGQYLIAKHLDNAGIKPRKGEHWSEATIKDILTNPAYNGKVRWGWRPVRKVFEDGSVQETRQKQKPKEYKIIDGLHEAIIDDITWKKAQTIRQSNYNQPVTSNKILCNPLSGLLYCGYCGSAMTRVAGNKKKTYYAVKCTNKYCHNVMAPLYVVEEQVVKGLRHWIEQYRLTFEEEEKTIVKQDADIISLDAIRKDINRVSKQLDNTYDLLEQGIYDKDTFLSRNKKLSDEKTELQNNLIEITDRINKCKEMDEKKDNYIPEFERILEAYDSVESASERNELLKRIVSKIYYKKDTPNTKGKRDEPNFDLDIHPVLPDAEEPL